MIQRLRRLLGKDAQEPPAPPPPDYTAQLEAWINNQRRTHLIAPVKGELVWVPKSPKGSVWLVWRYMQMDPDNVKTRDVQGPTVRESTEDNLAHSDSRLPGQVW